MPNEVHATSKIQRSPVSVVYLSWFSEGTIKQLHLGWGIWTCPSSLDIEISLRWQNHLVLWTLFPLYWQARVIPKCLCGLLVFVHQVLSLFTSWNMVLSNQNVSLFRNKISVDTAVKIQLCLGRWGSSNPLGMCPSNEVSLETGTHRENPTGQEGGGQNGTAQTRAEQALAES